MAWKYAIPGDVIAPLGFTRFTLRYEPSYGEGGVDHELVRFDEDNRLFFRNSDAKMVWLVGGEELASSALTFSVGQELSIEVEHSATRRMIVVAGATAGDGKSTADPLTAMFPPSMAFALSDEDGGGSVLVALVPDLETFAELADERTLSQFDDTEGNRVFRDFAAILAEGAGRFRDVAMAVRAAFDRESAVGAQLGMIGAVVGLPREGAEDERYRVLLDIQIELLLSAERDDGQWTGVSENIIRIARKFVGDLVPVGGVVLENVQPYDYQLTLVEGLATLDLDAMKQLMRFLRAAAFAGVRGVAIAAHDVWGADTVDVPHAGMWGADTVTIPGASDWGMAVES